MVWKASLACALLVFAISNPAKAEMVDPLETGNTFYSSCSQSDNRSSNYFNSGLCYGFLRGILARENLIRLPERLICPPAQTTNSQIMDIVQLYLRNNPANRHVSAEALILIALHDAFPCQNAK